MDAEVDGLTRSEALVLAELARRPRGLASRREVARACSISPATASKAIGGLIASGLVTETPTVLPLGIATTVRLLRANAAHPRWTGLLPQLRVIVPAAQGPADDRLPARLRHAFWNVPPATYRTLTAGGASTDTEPGRHPATSTQPSATIAPHWHPHVVCLGPPLHPHSIDRSLGRSGGSTVQVAPQRGQAVGGTRCHPPRVSRHRAAG
ncbi:MAG: MarR family transcriptional regulator [Actinomycetales bacterium]|nr:MarR family transcriptional regulator [Actinomycetales bacterium]